MTASSCLRSERLDSGLLPYRLYVLAAIGLAVAGILISSFLAYSHYRIHTDVHYQSFCALSKAINCDTVSQSPYSVWWGLPLAVWGGVVYSFILILVLFSAAPSARRRRVWTIILVVAFLCSLASVGFAGLSVFFIGSWCILCIATYVINFLLFFLSWIIRKRFHAESLASAFVKDLSFLWGNISWTAPMFGVLGAGLVLILLVFPSYWDIKQTVIAAHLKTGMTDDGLPWIGAENPVLEIVEFTDYQCFQCRKMHLHMLQLLARHAVKIRLIQRHFPMDHEFNPIVKEPFHVGSGRLAMLVIHAAAKGKFREMNDWLFFKMSTRPNTIPLSEAAAATGIDVRELAAALEHAPYRLLLKRDIHEGLSLGIVGTPSYVINGKVFEGNIPAEVLKPILKKLD
jgi:uncharacterized membrane protein/protein-disulfide isomerase